MIFPIKSAKYLHQVILTWLNRTSCSQISQSVSQSVLASLSCIVYLCPTFTLFNFYTKLVTQREYWHARYDYWIALRRIGKSRNNNYIDGGSCHIKLLPYWPGLPSLRLNSLSRYHSPKDEVRLRHGLPLSQHNHRSAWLDPSSAHRQPLQQAQGSTH